MVRHPPRAVPLGAVPPVGAGQGTPKPRTSARGRRPRPRICFRKGCGHKYQPRRWNQRYCQDPQCQRELKRWQAARRQAKRRRNPRVKAQQAQAQKRRRERAKTTPKTVENSDVAPARGHAAKIFSPPHLRSARLLPTPHDFAPQPGSLLLCRLPSGTSQRPGPGT